MWPASLLLLLRVALEAVEGAIKELMPSLEDTAAWCLKAQVDLLKLSRGLVAVAGGASWRFEGACRAHAKRVIKVLQERFDIRTL